jgi:hypothetical protein
VVDLNATKSAFDYAINQIKLRIEDRSTPFVLYIVGHGGQGIFVFDPEQEGIENVSDFGLRQMLEDIPLDPAFIAIWTCDAGGFITLDFSKDSISVEGKNRIIVTGAHEHDTLRMYDLARSSDRLWGNLNTGLNIREAFVRDVTQADVDHRLLDDNGDQEGNPPNNLRSDGELAARTIIGVPNTYELALVPWYQALIHSAGELRVYDSQNRVTGLFNGEVKEEIPDSIYGEEDETVAIFSPSASYRYEVVGTGEGTYGLEVNFIKGVNVISFTATDIPTTSGTVHDYAVDWDALSRDEKGVTVQVDSDGDGTFERTFTSDGELTRNEFIPRSGCFIATAAYGTPMAEDVQTLREFRDEYLLTNVLGQAFVDFYYRVSPLIAEFITEHPILKPIVRAGLMPAMVISTIAVNTTSAEKAAILGLLVLVSVALAVWVARRRRRGPQYS